MASPLHWKHGFKGIGHGLGAVGFVGNSLVETGAGYGIGFLYGKYRNHKLGKAAPLLAAFAGKALAATTLLIGSKVHGGSGAATYLAAGAFDSMGGAGLALVGAHYGLVHGLSSAGLQATVEAKGTALPAGRSALGALPPAQEGDGLSWNQLMQLSSMP